MCTVRDPKSVMRYGSFALSASGYLYALGLVVFVVGVDAAAILPAERYAVGFRVAVAIAGVVVGASIGLVGWLLGRRRSLQGSRPLNRSKPSVEDREDG